MAEDELSLESLPQYQPLLSKVYGGSKERLNNDVRALLEGPHRSLNVRSAVAKLVREKGRVELPEPVDVSGYFLQFYQRAPKADSDKSEEPGVSVYLATRNGVRTIHAPNREALPSAKAAGMTGKVFGEKQKWTGLTQVQDVIQDRISLRTRKDVTKIAPADQASIGPKLWEMAKDITVIKDGQGIWHAWVGTIFPVGIFDAESHKRTDYRQILDNNGAAHLSIGLVDEIDRKTGRAPQGKKPHYVEITTESQLKTFLGSYFDEETLMRESKEAAKELADALVGQSVVVFGSGRTPQAEGQRRPVTEPRIRMYNGNGTISPWLPEN